MLLEETSPASESLIKRLDAAELALKDLRTKIDAPKPKDRWDKLAALSTVLSGVIIAGLGLWINRSLQSSQQQAQEVQAAATRDLEGSHNRVIEQQATAALELQRQQFEYTKQLEQIRQQIEHERAENSVLEQREQSRNALVLQKAQADAAIALQQAQLAKDFLPQLEASSRSRSAALRIMEQVNPAFAVILSANYSETTLSPELKAAAETTLRRLESDAAPDVREAAVAARNKASYAAKAQAIVEVFETGQTQAGYSKVSILATTLAYGRGLVSLNSDNLYSLLVAYAGDPGARYAERLQPYLPRTKEHDPTLLRDSMFRSLLENAGSDPAMQRAQDDFFAKTYWEPAQRAAERLGLTLPLSLVVVFDSIVQGGFQRLVTSTTNQLGGTPVTGVDERQWIQAYLAARREWILSLRPPLPQTAYRAEALQKLAAESNWELRGPLVVRGVTIGDGSQ